MLTTTPPENISGNLPTPISKVHGPGLYFGLPEQPYFDDTALGSGDMRALVKEGAPGYFWQSPYNPNKPDDDKPSLVLGKAIHKLVLEGSDAFDRLFVRSPHSEDMDGPAKSAATKDMKKRLRDAGRFDVTVLPGDAYDRAVIASSMITLNPGLRTAFQNGMPEVSIFWSRGDGIRRKARLDFLKPRGVGDLKSASNFKRIEFSRACREAIANMRYEIQAAHYLEARAMIPRLVSDGLVFGDYDPEFLKAVCAERRFAFQFVFYATTGAPIPWSCVLSPPQAPGEPGNPILDYASREIDRATDMFAEAMLRFGPDTMWTPSDRPAELTMDSLPKWWAMTT
jgi:PDDEXK-like domain of unknown function (DUF3799)